MSVGDTARETARARAAAWLADRRSSENWSEQQQAELDAWLAQSPSHAVEFLRLEAAWDRTERLAALRPSRRSAFAGGNRAVSIVARVAAGVAVVILLGLGVRPFLRTPTAQTFATEVGGHKSITLSDGSIIELNTDTALRVATANGERHVWLDRGEAFFQVTHDADRPFVVTAGDHRVIDIGTKFGVRREAQAVRVTLVEGSARVEAVAGAPQHSAVLKPGDIAMATHQALTVQRQSLETVANALGWRRGMLVFHHATLADAVAEFNRYNTEKIAMGDAYAAALTFNGALPTNDIAAFVRVTQKTFALHVVKRGNEIVISR